MKEAMPVMRTRITRLSAAVSFLLGVFSLSSTVLAEPPASVYGHAPNLPEVARGVPMGGALQVFDLSLDQAGTTTLDLVRFAVFEQDATIEVKGGPAMPVPDVAYFRGRAADDPGSTVMLAAPAKGKVHGVIMGASGAWLFESGPGKSGLKTRKVDLESELAGRTFDCGADKLGAEFAAAGLQVPAAPLAEGLAGIPLPLNIQYTAHMIIDTDYEYWQMFWNICQYS